MYLWVATLDTGQVFSFWAKEEQAFDQAIEVIHYSYATGCLISLRKGH